MKEKLTAKFREEKQKEFKVSEILNRFQFTFDYSKVCGVLCPKMENSQKVYEFMKSSIYKHLSGVDYIITPSAKHKDGLIIVDGMARIQILTPAVISQKKVKSICKYFTVSLGYEKTVGVNVKNSQEALGTWEEFIKMHNDPSDPAYGKILLRIPKKTIGDTWRKHRPAIIKTTIQAGCVIAFEMMFEGLKSLVKVAKNTRS